MRYVPSSLSCVFDHVVRNICLRSVVESIKLIAPRRVVRIPSHRMCVLWHFWNSQRVLILASN